MLHYAPSVLTHPLAQQGLEALACPPYQATQQDLVDDGMGNKAGQKMSNRVITIR